eukprot:scaffold44673_cov229-Amphora_coffeaeformis.AAC.3
MSGLVLLSLAYISWRYIVSGLHGNGCCPSQSAVVVVTAFAYSVEIYRLRLPNVVKIYSLRSMWPVVIVTAVFIL